MSVPRVRIIGLLFLVVSFCLVAAPSRAFAREASPKPPPKLILQITIVQLRGDLLRRYFKNMDRGGFRYLLDQGVVYDDTHHAHATMETIVGQRRWQPVPIGRRTD